MQTSTDRRVRRCTAVVKSSEHTCRMQWWRVFAIMLHVYDRDKAPCIVYLQVSRYGKVGGPGSNTRTAGRLEALQRGRRGTRPAPDGSFSKPSTHTCTHTTTQMIMTIHDNE